jgi:hypothetical protein
MKAKFPMRVRRKRARRRFLWRVSGRTTERIRGRTTATKTAAIQAEGPAPAGVQSESVYEAAAVRRKRKKRTVRLFSKLFSEVVRRVRVVGELTG